MISLRRWRGLSALILAGAVAGVASCSADGGSTDARDPADESGEALTADNKAGGEGEMGRPGGPGARRPFHGHGHGGHAFLLVATLHELELTPAQKTTIEGALKKSMDGAGPKGRGPMDRSPFKAIADGVRAGKIDTTAVLAKLDSEGHGPQEHAAAAEALQTLHATLTKEQRRTLVDTLAKRMEEHGPPGERFAKEGHRGPPPGERPERKGPPPEHEGARGAMPPPGGPIGFLLHGLDLTEAQREAIDKAMETNAAQRPAPPDEAAMKKRFEAMRTEMRARAEAFAADSFDAKAFVAPPAGAEAGRPKQHMEHMVKELAIVVSILEPAQREKLAARLEKGPPAPPMGPPGAPHGPREHGQRGAPAAAE